MTKWEQAASKVPLLNAPWHLFNGLVLIPITYLVIAPPAAIIAGIGASVALLVAPVELGNIAIDIVVKALMICLIPCVIVFTVVATLSLPLYGMAASAGNLLAAALDVVMTPISIFSRSFASLLHTIKKPKEKVKGEEKKPAAKPRHVYQKVAADEQSIEKVKKQHCYPSPLHTKKSVNTDKIAPEMPEGSKKNPDEIQPSVEAIEHAQVPLLRATY